MTVSDRVREFVLEAFYVSDPDEFNDDTSLLRSGIVDSTGMLDIILFIETEFDIQVRDDDTTPQNLETIRRISEFVDRKQAAAHD